MQAGSAGSCGPGSSVFNCNYCFIFVVQMFTYACDDQLSCSLNTPKMGAVVETWHKHQPLILGMHRYTSSIIACFLVRHFLVREIVSLETFPARVSRWRRLRKIVFVRVSSITISSQSIDTSTVLVALFYSSQREKRKY